MILYTASLLLSVIPVHISNRIYTIKHIDCDFYGEKVSFVGVNREILLRPTCNSPVSFSVSVVETVGVGGCAHLSSCWQSSCAF